jgi:hypothetical protein
MQVAVYQSRQHGFPLGVYDSVSLIFSLQFRRSANLDDSVGGNSNSAIGHVAHPFTPHRKHVAVCQKQINPHLFPLWSPIPQ